MRSNSHRFPAQPIQQLSQNQVFKQGLFEKKSSCFFFETDLLFENLPSGREKLFWFCCSLLASPALRLHHPTSRAELPPCTLEAHLNLWQTPLRTTGHTEVSGAHV